MKITVFSTSAYEKPFIEEANNNRFTIHYERQALSGETADAAGDSEAVMIFTNDDASAEVLEKLKNQGVKYIATRTMGVDHLDVKKLKELGLKAANVPHYSPHSVAEHSVALMLALNRKLMMSRVKVLQHDFRLEGLVGFDMNGKTVGFLGAGEIGAVSVKILHGFGCRILINDIKKNEELIENYDAEYVDSDRLCRESDIISIHTPLTDETEHMLNAELIGKMKKGVMIINTARGAVIKTEDLIEGLKSGQIGSAGLDVYENETGLFFKDHSFSVLQDDIFAHLLSFNNVIITTHQAFLTKEALKQNFKTTFENLSAWADGKEPENQLK